MKKIKKIINYFLESVGYISETKYEKLRQSWIELYNQRNRAIDECIKYKHQLNIQKIERK